MAGTRESNAAEIRVLVVDDDPHARQEVMDGLRHRGYEAKGAEDGLQALHHLQRERFDLVITDIQMPRMDGVALLHEIRRKAYAPVVVRTTLLDPSLQEMLCRAGAAGVLAKGEPIADLMRLLSLICRGDQDISP